MKVIKKEFSEESKQKLKKWRKRALWMIPLILLFLLISSSYYTVKENEQAVLMTFGKYSKTVDAGLNFKLPWPFQEALILPVKRTQKIELGYTQSSDGQYSSLADDSLMITGDMNIVSIDFFVEWKISDPVKYLFISDNPQAILRNMLQSSVRSVVGTRTIDDALTTGKIQIQSDVKELLTQKLEKTDIGVQILDVKVNDSEPPTEDVAKAFRDVETAKQDKATAINLAMEYKNSRLPAAKSDKDKIVKAAEAAKQSKINEAEGERERFIAMYNEFTHYPAITKERMYLEAIESILPGLTVYIDDGSGVNKLLPLGSWSGASTAEAGSGEAAARDEGDKPQ